MLDQNDFICFFVTCIIHLDFLILFFINIIIILTFDLTFLSPAVLFFFYILFSSYIFVLNYHLCSNIKICISFIAENKFLFLSSSFKLFVLSILFSWDHK